MSLTVNSIQAKELIIDCLKAKKVPMLTGSPGIGKSAILQQICEEFDLKLIDLRLSQCDPTDLLGFPTVDKERGKAGYMPMDTFPLDSDPIPKGYKGWFLFLDEMNSAPVSVQAAAYKLVLDHSVGQFKLHPKVATACAGNLDTDNAIVHEMSTAMQSRMIHLELKADSAAWLAWANANDIDYRITSYINYKPENLQKFDPDHNDKTFACARTWEFASDLIKQWPDKIDRVKLPLLAGTVSEGVAREFLGFCDIFQTLPTVQDIVADPMGIKVPDEPSINYALAGSISNYMDASNVEDLMKFVRRVPLEFQVITLQDTLKRNKGLLIAPAIKDWVSENAMELF